MDDSTPGKKPNTSGHDLSATPLGKHSDYPETYAPEVLYTIPRGAGREQLGIDETALPFSGEDIWNAYELSWLDQRGKPQVAQACIRVPAQSPAIIESKSLKLYLNSFNQSRLGAMADVQALMQADLSAAAGSPVSVAVAAPAVETTAELPGLCLDSLAIDVHDYEVNPDLLHIGADIVSEQLHSHLLRSLCPVTGQPDWASVAIAYSGPAIEHASLLRYLISYRQHQGFHEQCVEQIFLDIQQRCQPQSLSVFARYLRLVGLDINPYRSSSAQNYANTRLSRQ